MCTKCRQNISIRLNMWVTEEASVEMKGPLYCVLVIRHNFPGWLRRTVTLCTVYNYCFLPVCRLYMTSCLPSIAMSIRYFAFLVNSVIVWFAWVMLSSLCSKWVVTTMDGATFDSLMHLWLAAWVNTATLLPKQVIKDVCEHIASYPLRVFSTSQEDTGNTLICSKTHSMQ